MGVEGTSPAGSRLNMPAISHVFTVRRAAEILSQDEALLRELSDQLTPEDGMLWVHDVGEGETLAFTRQGIEALYELIKDQLNRAT